MDGCFCFFLSTSALAQNIPTPETKIELKKPAVKPQKNTPPGVQPSAKEVQKPEAPKDPTPPTPSLPFLKFLYQSQKLGYGKLDCLFFNQLIL